MIRSREASASRAATRSVHDGIFVASLGGVIALAWAAVLVWGLSPYGRFLSHEDLGTVSAGEGYLVMVFVAGWTLMIVAMMLPTTWPLLSMFNSMTRSREEHGRLVALVVAGYLGIWISFGVLVHAGDWVLHGAVERSAWLSSNTWVIGAGTLVLAGLYQFSRLKYYCLDKCRSPYAFIVTNWHGRNERREALLLGARHGLFCLGCCWSLMLLMFVVGSGNLVWMFLLGTIMAIEKNASWGRRLSAPVGAWLLAGGLATALFAG